MNLPSKKRNLVRRSIVELDLAGYSHVARILEEQLNAGVVQDLNDQVQDFVNAGLREVGCKREDVVYGTAGDNALVLFERASEAHRFAEAVHRAAAEHNASKTDPAAHRNFRIGISTGEISVRGKQIAGKCIIDSVRLEAAGQRGHVIIDTATYNELPGRFQPCYRGPETVTDKQRIKYEIFRYAVLEVVEVTPPASLSAGNAPEAPGIFHADISRINKYAPAELIGREAETKLLSDAWEKAVRGETKRPHVLTFVALGGEGKTALVAKWAAELAH